jgi:hypothetical protein
MVEQARRVCKHEAESAKVRVTIATSARWKAFLRREVAVLKNQSSSLPRQTQANSVEDCNRDPWRKREMKAMSQKILPFAALPVSCSARGTCRCFPRFCT